MRFQMIKTIKKLRQHDWINGNIHCSFWDYCMSIRIYQIMPIMLLGLLITLNVCNIEAQRSEIFNTFKDSDTGISLQYPSDWHITSKEYNDYLFGSSGSSST